MNKQMQTSGEGGEGGIAKLLLVCLFQQAFRIQVLSLNILEVAVSTHLQFFGGRIVTNDDTLSCICKALIVHICITGPSTA